jgi:D-alanyl-D-alanine carboxypeptidase
MLMSLLLLWMAPGVAGTQATGVEIRMSSGTTLETQGREQLVRILETHDLENWLFTRVVEIQSGAIPHSHPVLTLNTGYLGDDVAQLSTFLHEQLHWYLADHVPVSSTDAAIEELRHLFPRAPAEPPEGARSETSTYSHLIVCYLELEALSELVGLEAAREKLASWEHYTWVYSRVLDETTRIGEVVDRHIGGVHLSAERKRESELLDLLDKLREEAGAPGAILGVSAGEGRPLVVASGYADRDNARPLTPETPYFLGSISKTYTAVAVLRLAEEGRLSLDDTVDRFLPSFPEGSKITVRHLLAHTSGLKDFYSYLYYRTDRVEMIELVTKEWSKEELLDLAGRFGRWFDPGTDWSYSSTNYYLLGVIVERASGASLPEAYRRYIYEPLGIDETWLAWHEEVRTPLPVPTGYLGPVAEWKHSEMFGELGATTALDRSPVEWGAGGLVAPAEDALRFLRGLVGGKLLGPASLQAMTRFRSTPPLGTPDPNATPPARSDGYGLGLVEMERAGVTLLGHGGLFTGHTAGLWHVPDCGITIALYFNRGFINQRAILDELLPVVTGSQGGWTKCDPSR